MHTAQRRPVDVTVAWLVGIACRHKLADHWRRLGREERRLALVANAAGSEPTDPWDDVLDVARAREVLAGLGGHHRLPPSPCGTWTACRCPRWPGISAAPCTPPKRCWLDQRRLRPPYAEGRPDAG